MTRTMLTSVAALGLSVGAASAATMDVSDSISLQSTNWSENLSVAQFDSSLGTLVKATVSLTGTVEGEGKAESLDTSPADISLDLQAAIEASTSSLASLGTVVPIVSSTFSLGAFDGTIDFAGASGVSSGTVSGSDSDLNSFMDADLASFIGGGFIDILVEATGQSSGSGAGNLITQFATSASAQLTITYEYEEDNPGAIPLPAGGLLLLTGFAGIAGLKRRKKKAA